MSFLAWTALASGVLLVMALASSYVRRLPVTTAALYLALGVVLGPAVSGLVVLDVKEDAIYLERAAELGVIVALFVSGLKLRLGWRDPAWRAAFWLAGPAMVLTIGGVAAVGYFVLGLAAAPALLLGAVLAPTDPVLAGEVAVNDSDDHDRLRYGLSGEAGLNDGTAFPFVLLALAWAANDGAGTWIAEWALVRLVWAIPTALVLGYGLGWSIGRLAIKLRNQERDHTAPSDLFALALIGLAYVAADAIGAWGFLSVFAAGLGLRAAEVTVVGLTPHPDATVDGTDPVDHPPAEALIDARVDPEALDQPAVAAGVLVSETLSFGDTVERLVGVLLTVVIGIVITTYWDWRALPLALLLFVVIRPLAVRACLSFTPTTRPQRWLMGWFGIRGIGSLYYLAYAIGHGGDVSDVMGLTISVVGLSIVIHGATSTPLLQRYERSLDD